MFYFIAAFILLHVWLRYHYEVVFLPMMVTYFCTSILQLFYILLTIISIQQTLAILSFLINYIKYLTTLEVLLIQ